MEASQLLWDEDGMSGFLGHIGFYWEILSNNLLLSCLDSTILAVFCEKFPTPSEKFILIGGVTTLLLQIFFFYKIYKVFKFKSTYPTEMRFSKAEFKLVWIFPTVTCLLKLNNRNTRARCDICSRLTIKIREQRQWCRSGVFIVNFEHILNHILVFLLLTFNM